MKNSCTQRVASKCANRAQPLFRWSFLVIALVFLTLHTTSAQWIPGYSYKTRIKINATEVCGNGTLTSFPAYISVSGANLRLSPTGLVEHPGAFDVVFASSDHVTLLQHERASYDPALGTYSAWVNIPSLNGNVDTDIYMYYGNAAIVTDPSSPMAWGPDFRTVYHFDQDDFSDATTNGFDAANNGTTSVTGKFGDARDFDGVAAYVQSTSNELATANNFTISLWFKTDALNPAHMVWQGVGTENGWGNGVGGAQEMNLSVGTCCPGNLATPDYLSFFLGDREEQVAPEVLTAELPFNNNADWQHVAVTVSNLDSSPLSEIFLNGTSVAVNAGAADLHTARDLWNTDLRLGRPGASQRFFDGQMDEFRIATTVRSADWVCTEFNNQSDPASFSTTVNQAPELGGIEVINLAYAEGSGPVIITNALTASDWEQPNLTGATIRISSNYQNGEDVLGFTDAFGITGSYDASTGTLTLSGTASLLNYASALRSITYENTNTANPSTAVRTVSFVVSDGADNSIAVTRDIDVSSVNDAPQLASIEATPIVYLEDAPAVALTASLVVSDPDNAMLSGATIQISTNYVNGQDILGFNNTPTITGSFNAATGILTLSGIASVNDYQSALRTVTYANTNITSPSTLARTVSFIVTDGALNSNTVSRTITVTAVNDAPVLASIEVTNLNYNEGQAATVISATIDASDVDHTNLTGATIQITGNYTDTEDILTFNTVSGITGVFDASTGTMTLSGTTTVTNYRNALRTVRYQNANSDNPSSLVRTVSFTVTDGTDQSNTISRNINVNPVNDVPVLSGIEAGTVSYTEDQAPVEITASLAIADVDNTTLASATVQITGNYQSSQDVLSFSNAFGITSTYNSSNGLLTLTGPASVTDFEAALRSVTYHNTNTGNPSTAVRTVTFRVNDGAGNSNTTTRTITITLANDAPVLSAIEGTSLSYNEGQAATVITGTINVTDVDNSSLTGAVVQITGNYLASEDVLSFVDNFGITGAYDAATGTMTLSGTTTLANYRSALRSIRYQNINTDAPSTLIRTVTFTVSDGLLNSASVSRNIIVNPVNDVPVLAAIEGTALDYTEDQGPVPITGSITVNDVDNTTLQSATVQITGNYSSAQDRLAFVNAFGITSTFNTTNGTLTLTGSASLADYQTALRSVTYENINTVNPSTSIRTVTFRVNDGAGNSNTQTRSITIGLVNDAPVLDAIEVADLVYSEGQAATAITATTTVTDLDNTNLAGAVVQITSNYIDTEDVLSFTAASGITGIWDPATGTMTLTGSSSVTNYRNAVRNVRYRNTNNATPSPLTRTVSFVVRDAEFNSNTVSRNIQVVPVNDPPQAVNESVSMDEETVLVIDVLANDIDVDDIIDPGTVTVVTHPANGTATVDPLTGALTYVPDENFSGTNTIQYTVNDASGATSNIATVTVTVVNINDVPVFTKGADVTVLEDAGTQTISGWATGIDDGDPFTSQSVSFVLSNDNSSLFASQPAVNSSGTLTFRSAGNASGVANVTIYIRDNGPSTAPHINQSAPQTFVITVLPVNDAPIANDDFYSTSSDTPLTANLRTNDSDRENSPLTVSATPAVLPALGTVSIAPSGVFTYTPNEGALGTDTFTYEICDDGNDNGPSTPLCSQAVVTVTINPPNDLYNIVGNNSIQVSTHCFILTKALNNQQGAVWSRNPLDLRYSFDLNFDAIFSDTSVVRDGGADGIIFVLQRDDTPPPLNVPASPIEARGAVGEYLGVGGVSPSIGIEVDTYRNGGEPDYDHIAISKDGSVYDILSPPVPAKVDADDTPLNIEDGETHTVRISWDKPSNTLRVYFDGVERTSYTADVTNTIFNGDPTNIYWGFSASTGGQNNHQGVCGIDMVTINLPPVVTDEVVATDEDTPLSGSLLDNDADPEQSAIRATPETKSTANGEVTILADGSYTYTPNKDYFGADSFTYQVCDAFGVPGCTQGNVTVTVLPTPDNPVAVADAYSLAEDTPLTISAPGVLSNDFDVDGDAITAVLVAGPSNGTLVLNNDGSFTYTPAADYNGLDNFTYHTFDGATASPTVTVALTVNPVNDAPVAVDDVTFTNEDTAVNIEVKSNDSDPDNAIASLVVTILAGPSSGVATVDNGTIRYTPNLDYSGSDSFTYQLTDPAGAVSASATVSVTINAVNDAPVAGNDTATTPEDTSITIDVLANDTDVDDLIVPASVTVNTPPSHGSVSISASNGEITYTPSPDYFGTDSFTYTVRDQSNAISNSATVTVHVTPVNDAPSAINDNATTRQALVQIAVLDNDIDIDNPIDAGSVAIINPPVHGTVTVDPVTGVISYQPDADYLGSDSFTYSVLDADGLSSNVATVSLMVTPANQPPVAVDDGPVVFSLYRPVVIDALGNDFDTDHPHGELTIVSVGSSTMGTLTIEGGVIVFTPHNLLESATITFTYVISDPEGLTSEATITLIYEHQPLTISEGFSPNGDGNNDHWYIRSIENFPGNRINIFNRWGLLVYSCRGYDNEGVFWDGRANTGMESGKLLDHGTYYYTIDLGNNSKTLSGFVVIVR